MCGRHTLIRNTSYSSSLPLPCFGIWCFRNWLKTLLSSPPWDPVAGCGEWLKAAPEEVQTGLWEAFLHWEGVRHWNRLPSHWELPKAPGLAVFEALGQSALTFGQPWIASGSCTFQVKNIIFYPLVGPIFRTGTILDCQVYSIFF